MQLVLAVFLLAILGGLLASLWYVLTNPRRRARQVADELSAPASSQSKPFAVKYNRAASGAAFVLFALVGVSATEHAHGGVTAVMVSLLFLAPAIFYARAALITNPVLVITGTGIKLSRAQTSLRWQDIESIAIRDGVGYAGIEQYDLEIHLARCAVKPPARRWSGIRTDEGDLITVPLALLTPSWPKIARAIHERSGRPPVVPTRFTQTPLANA